MVTAFVGGTVIDGTGRTIPSAVILVDQGIITALGTREEIPVPADATVHNVAGRTIIPGLVDCHVHVCSSGRTSSIQELKRSVPLLAVEGATNAYKCLRAGFTTIRDTGGQHLINIGVRQAIDQGVFMGPRMKAYGAFITITGGHADFQVGWPPEVQIRGHITVDGPIEARKAARQQLRDGADGLKVGATGGVLSEGSLAHARCLTREELEAIVDEGLNVGKKTAAHAQGEIGAENAILAGVASIEHGCFLTDRLLEMMVERDVFLVPTLVTLYTYIEQGTDAGIPEYAVEKAKRLHDIHLNSFERAYRAGVKIALGTDAGMPYNYHGNNAAELGLMMRAGMSAMDALITAAAGGAELLGMGDQIGTLKPGKFADMVILTSDPLQDIGVLRKPGGIEMVVKNGEIVGDMIPGIEQQPPVLPGLWP